MSDINEDFINNELDQTNEMVPDLNDGKEIKPIASQEEFQKMILDNQNFAYSIVNKQFSKYSWNVKQDLNSAAITGLVYAATKYDPARKDECHFISYAVHWIRYYIHEEIRRLYPVRFNQNFVTKRKKVTSFIEKYKKSHKNKMPSLKLISKNIGLSEKVVQGVLNVNGGENFSFVSFNTPVDVGDSDGNEAYNESKIMTEYYKTHSCCSPQVKAEVNDLFQYLKKTVPTLDYNIYYDFYMNGETLSQLKEKYGLPFPSSVKYIIKKCDKICRNLEK